MSKEFQGGVSWYLASFSWVLKLYPFKNKLFSKNEKQLFIFIKYHVKARGIIGSAL